jgi:ribonuclease D
MQSHGVIINSEQLKDFYKEISQEEFIAVDTEFLREKTYYPKLCLVQIASSKACAIIDPLAENIDLSPLKEIMASQKITKIFHSARQDIEVLLSFFDLLPAPAFDTQIAAMFCGLGGYISYQSLVYKLLNVHISKSSQAADWSKRPLSQAQINYALTDVKYLCEIYRKLEINLKEHKRTSWMQEEMVRLLDISHYCVKPEDAWKRIKINGCYHKFLCLIKALAQWREAKAQEQNKPRNQIIDDDSIFKVIDMYKKNRIIRLKNAVMRDEVLAVLKKNDFISDELSNNVADQKKYSESKRILSMLKIVLDVQCQEMDLVHSLIATNNDLARFLEERDKDNKIFQGWRYDVFGKYAVGLIEGKLGLYIHDNQLKLK